MKPRILSTARLSFPLATAIAALLAAPAASATAFFWDGDVVNGGNPAADANGGTGTWNTTLTNWDTLATAGIDTAWTNGNQAVFAGTAGTVTLGTAITVSGNTAVSGTSAMFFGTTGYIVGGTNSISTTAASTFRLNGTTFNSGVSIGMGLDRTLTLNITGTNSIAGVISGTGTSGLTIANTGTLAITNEANTFTGGVTIGSNVGVVTLQVTKLANGSANSSLGAGTGAITIGQTSNSSILELVGGTSASSTNRQVRIGGNHNGNGSASIVNNNTNAAHSLVFTNTAFNLQNATTSSTRTLTLGGSNAGANEIQGAIINNANNVGVSVNGTGHWILSGTNTYDGGTTVSQSATLTISGDNSGRAAGVTASTAGTGATTPRLNVNSATALGAGTLNFGGGLSSDTVRLDNTSGGLVSVSTNNVFTMSRNFTFIGTQSLDLGGMTTTLAGMAANTQRSITVSASTLTLGGTIVDGTNPGSGIAKSGAGTLAIKGTTSYTGTTSISAGTLSLTGSMNGGGLVSTSGTGILTQSAAGVISGTSTLTQGSTGTSTLAGVNTYNGATNINGGTLALGATGTIDNTSGVVLGTGTFDVSAKGVGGYSVGNLSGSGTVVGSLTVSTQLAIGSSPGTINFENLALSTGTTYLYELNDTGNTADLGNVTGTLNLGSAILDLVQLGTFTLGEKFTLFSYDTVGDLTGTFSGLADGAEFDDAGGRWLINYDDATAGLNGGSRTLFVTVTAVIPEPNVAALLGGLGVLALLRRRR